MTNTVDERIIVPPGPTEKFDLHLSGDTFSAIKSLIIQYGDICRIGAVRRKQDAYLINNPDYVKHVLLTNSANYVKGIGFDRVKMLLGNGLIVSDGDQWRKQRRMIQPAFNKVNIGLLSKYMFDCNLALLAEWDKIADTGESVNITEAMSHLALEIILRAIFSHDLEKIIELNGGENPFLFFADDSVRDLSVVLKFRTLTKLIVKIIEQRRDQGSDHQDFLAMYLEATDKETGQPMLDKELIDEITTLIVAGHETAATTLNWAWYLLSQNGDSEYQLHKEVDQLELRLPGFDELATLGYTKQILEETLRLYPPVWLFTRKALADDVLGDFPIPEHTDILIAPFFLHRNEKYWPEPDMFRPERFTQDMAKARHRFAYIPFSVGPRRCIGDFFGITEMQIHLAIMASRFQLHYAADEFPGLDPAVNLRSKKGIPMLIKRR